MKKSHSSSTSTHRHLPITCGLTRPGRQHLSSGQRVPSALTIRASRAARPAPPHLPHPVRETRPAQGGAHVPLASALPERCLRPSTCGQHQGGQKLTAPSADGWWQALPETALASSLTSGRLPESSVGSAVPTGDLLSATASATLLPRLGAPLFPDVLGPRPERLPAKASGPHVRVGFRGPPGGRAAGGPARSFLPLGPCSGGDSGLRGQVGTLSSSVLRATATDR